MRPQTATTREQSRVLIFECGIDTRTADMAWSRFSSDGDNYDMVVMYDEYAVEPGNYDVVAAWSLTALLDVMPKSIYDNFDDQKLMLYPHNGNWKLHYGNTMNVEERDLIAVCVMAIKWLVQYGFRDSICKKH